MITSVIFRGTGGFLVAGLALVSIASIPASKPYRHYLYQLQQYPVLNSLVKFGVAFPVTYHFLGGLRHLVRGACAARGVNGTRCGDGARPLSPARGR